MLDKASFDKLKKVICQIKNLSKKLGTGLLIDIPYESQAHFTCVITSQGIISKEMISSSSSFSLFLDNKKEIKIQLNKTNRGIFTLDFKDKKSITIIEIKESDKMPKNFFMEYSKSFEITSKESLSGKVINVFQCLSNGTKKRSKGSIKLTSINEGNFLHDTTSLTNESSGAPIFLADNLQIVGINLDKLANGVYQATFIWEIIKKLFNDNDFIALMKSKYPLLEDEPKIDDITNEEKKLIKEDEIKFHKEDEINDPIFEGVKDFDIDESILKSGGKIEINPIERQQEQIKIKNLAQTILHKTANDLPKTVEKKTEILVKEMTALGKILKKEIIEDKINNPENFVDINAVEKSSNEDNELHPVTMLAKNLEQNGVEKVAIKKSETVDKDVSAACLQLLFSGMATKTKLELSFDFGDKQNNKLLTNENERKKLHKNIKQKLSEKIGVTEDQFSIVNPRKGSYKLTVIFFTKNFREVNEEDIKDFINNNKEELKLKHFKKSALLEGMLLNKDMFDKAGDRRDPNWARPGEYRGPYGKRIEYFPPYKWVGYGLKVTGKYEDDRWLGCSNNEGEWWIAYHGCGSPNRLVNDGRISVAGNIINKGFIVGNRHEFTDDGINDFHDHGGQIDYDKNHPGQRCKRGAYFTPYIEYAEYFSGEYGGFDFNGEKYFLAFMCRVNPETTQIRELVNSEWICSGGSDEVRPYRILIKKYNGEMITRQHFYELRNTSINIKTD